MKLFAILVGVWSLSIALLRSAPADPLLPIPPQQHAAWTPPDGLPAPLVSATTALFTEGLADPRGGEYRQISVQTGGAWSGDGGVVKVHGWLLPAAGTAGMRYAVCWNGLVYPVVSAGDPASLSADVAAMVKTDAEIRAVQAQSNPTDPYFRFVQPGLLESQEASETSLLPLKAAFLVRLGDGALAQQFWNAWLAGTPPAHNNDDADLRDPYLRMTDEWVWALFKRTVTAHMRGEDQLSLASARQLSALQPVVETEAGRRGYSRQQSFDAARTEQPYFPYLDTLPRLLADEERRISRTEAPPALSVILTMPDRNARIAALIQDLDQVSARQWSQPGSVSPDDDPIVKALVAEGEDAVQPLITTVAGDTRLTRSVGFGRDFFQERYPIGVARTAYTALVDILHTSEFGTVPDETPNKPKIAAAIQAYWDKYKHLSAAERWYRILADDSASSAQWLDAAHEIVRPGDETITGGWIMRSLTFRGNAPPKGAALRQKHMPAVSALFARRVNDIMALSGTRGGDSRQYDDVEDATTLTLYFAAWDRNAARPVLRRQFETERATLDYWGHMTTITEGGTSLVKLTLARMQCQDPTALPDYIKWLQEQSLRTLPISESLEPLWRAPNNPAVLSEAAFLFSNPKSPWVPLVWNRPGYGFNIFEDLLDSPLLDLVSFRQAMLRALTDQTVVQTVTLGGPDEQADYNDNDQALDPFRPSVPQPFAVRRCDLYAWHLARLGGFPAFQYDWPLPKKNAAITEAAACLRRYGANLATDLPPIMPGILPGEGGSPDVSTPQIRFPRLAHPATAHDVAENRAIFALAPGARLLPLPGCPLAAQWLADHRYPRHTVVWTAPANFQKVIGYAQDGYVWQAEESRSSSRFYGFVGPHDIARVPAEEIEFPPADTNAWTQVSAGLDCALGLSAAQPLPYLVTLKGGQPLPLTIRLRSRRGLPQTLPAASANLEAAVLSRLSRSRTPRTRRPKTSLGTRASASASLRFLGTGSHPAADGRVCGRNTRSPGWI